MFVLLSLGCSALLEPPNGATGLAQGAAASGETQQISGSSGSGAFVIDNTNISAGGNYGLLASRNWRLSSAAGDGYGGDYLAAETESVSDPAVFWLESTAPECYRVEAWWSAGSNRTTAASYLAWGPSGAELGRVVVDQRQNGGEWNALGSWRFPAGHNEVVLSRWAASGFRAIADALRFTPCEADVGEVGLNSPPDGALVENPVRFEVSSSGVDRLVLDADGWELAEWSPAAAENNTSYTFRGTGTPRVITARGFDASGTLVALDQITIEVEDPQHGVDLDVPYFYQYNNSYEPGSTCGVTSVAMAINWWNPNQATPDDLYLTYGKAQAQSPSGIAALQRWEGLYARHTTGGTRGQIKSHLDAGRPVVVHGYWTGSGHITVIVGYDETDWLVNDPAGDWYTCYGCGYADHVRYPMGGRWDDLMSWDGDIWFTASSDTAF